MSQQNLLCGLFRRRECVVPTWRGWVGGGLLGIALIVIVMVTIHPYLGGSKPVVANILVVEGWVPDYVLGEVKSEFERNHYSRLYVTGGPLEVGMYLSEYKTYAELGAATLIRMGISQNVIEAVPSPLVQQDRTFTSAQSLKERLCQQAAGQENINLVSVGVHAKRSQLLFQKVFGKDARVGIIAIVNRGYDPKRWWQSSAGVRTVLDEFIAYIYALFVFPFVEP